MFISTCSSKQQQLYSTKEGSLDIANVWKRKLVGSRAAPKNKKNKRKDCLEAFDMEPAEMDRMLEFQEHLRQVQYLTIAVAMLY